MPRPLGVGIGLGRGGGVASFPTPTAFAGSLQSIIAHPAYCASDASHLVPCVDGSTVRWWQNAVSGTWHEQATVGDRPTFKSAGGGKYYADFNGTSHKFTFGSLLHRHVGLAVYHTAVGTLQMALSDNQDNSFRKSNGLATPWTASWAPDGGTVTWYVNNVATLNSGGLGVYERVQLIGSQVDIAPRTTRFSGGSPFDPASRLWNGRIAAAFWSNADLGAAAGDAWLAALIP